MLNRITLLLAFFIFHFQVIAQVQYTDMTAESGLTQLGKNYGLAVADFNNDGWDDVFATQQDEPCSLYQNNGDGTFTNIAQEAGVGYVGTPTAVAWADIDNDGWLDLMIGDRDSISTLFHNNGDGTFNDIAQSAGVSEGENVRAILFSDVDMDGFVDIYVVRFFLENILFKNNGDLTFTNNTDWSNATDNGLSMGALFFDYDNDGDPDLYLTRDGSQTFILYQNLGNGKFVDVSLQSGTDISSMGMGVDVGDINNDGWLDIYVTNLYYNTLLINDGENGFFGPSFDDISESAGVDDTGMGWGTTFLDCDNDGWQDIYMVNDSYFSPMPNLLYRNNGDNTFETLNQENEVASMEPSYGAASFDANNDGKVDILFSNYKGDLGNQFFLNETENENSFVKIKALGTISNRAAIGAKVTIEAGGIIQTDEIISGSSYASQNTLTLHFGLGDAEIIDRLIIRWPNGLIEEYEQMPVNTTYNIVEGNGYTSGVSENINAQKIEIFPNPIDDYLLIDAKGKEGKNVSILMYDQLGRIILSQNYKLEKPMIKLEALNILAGLYFVQINYDGKRETIRIIKH